MAAEPRRRRFDYANRIWWLFPRALSNERRQLVDYRVGVLELRCRQEGGVAGDVGQEQIALAS